jgi:mannose/cellobiose epimerase-like protein (N-acyl-D-glucosamine 2-epimerase family)
MTLPEFKLDSEVEATTLELLAYCRSENWAGYDPYDALNSPLFKALPILNSRLPQIALTQLMKRSPINLRGLALIPKKQNPKALALFLSALLKLRAARVGESEELARHMVQLLKQSRSPGQDYWCWGYSFPWQGRSILVPSDAPNLVCTTFVAGALLDMYDYCHDEECLTIAVSAARYILDILYWTEGEHFAGFSYPTPGVRGECHNANLLAAALFCRVHRYTGESIFLEPALRVARQAIAKQGEDGSWFYGEMQTQRWIDNFHTGFNLSAFRSIGLYADTNEFETAIRQGFTFYRNHFFRNDGAPKYYHDRTYPIDAHCVAQSILTLIEFKDLDPNNAALAHSVFSWAKKHMWDRQGFFYYRVLSLGTIRTSYMRWSEAWMLLALSTLLHSDRMQAQLPAANGSGLVNA